MPESIDSYRCPYCLNPHSTDQFECPATHLAIPQKYIQDQQEGVRTAGMLTIGYSDHGKTCYLASFIHNYYHGDLVHLWPGFSCCGLNSTTIDYVHDAYASPLELGNLPARTEKFSDPLILDMDRIPLASKAGPVTIRYKPSHLLLTLYDIGGEVFKAQETIKENLPLIGGLQNLVFLIDLKGIRATAGTAGAGPAQQLHRLLNTVQNAIDELGQRRRKGIVVCFSKADQLWGDSDYGPLAEPMSLRPGGADGMRAYLAEMRRRSRAIGEWVQAEYPQFFNSLDVHFRPIAFTAVSALGTTPQDGDGGKTVEQVRPNGLLDPLMSLLQMDGFL